MDKQTCLNRLEMHYFNFIACCATMYFMANEKTYELLKMGKLKTSMFEISFDGFAETLENKAFRELVISNFGKMAIRTFVKEYVELVKSYCEISNQLNLFRRQPWYQFARIIRNCLSHDMIFHFNKHDLSMLPVSFRDSVIDVGHDGKSLPLRNFNHNYAILLWQEMVEFIKTLN